MAALALLALASLGLVALDPSGAHTIGWIGAAGYVLALGIFALSSLGDVIHLLSSIFGAITDF